MFRTTAAILLLCAASSAWAQTTYDPRVAWTQTSGNSQYLWLANTDGTRAVRFGAAFKSIIGIDFAPGGGRIAFSDSQGLKVLSYTATNATIQFGTPQLLVGIAAGKPGPPDFSPDGNRVMYAAIPNTVYTVPAAGGAPTALCQCGGSGPRWLRSDLGDAFAYQKVIPHGPNAPVDYEIWTALVNPDGSVTTGPAVSTSSQVFKAIEDFDVSRTRNALLVTANYPTTIGFVEVDLLTQAVTPLPGRGFRAHYSSDDSRIVYRALPEPGSAQNIQSMDPTTGFVTALTKKGEFGVVDARP